MSLSLSLMENWCGGRWFHLEFEHSAENLSPGSSDSILLECKLTLSIVTLLTLFIPRISSDSTTPSFFLHLIPFSARCDLRWTPQSVDGKFLPGGSTPRFAYMQTASLFPIGWNFGFCIMSWFWDGCIRGFTSVWLVWFSGWLTVWCGIFVHMRLTRLSETDISVGDFRKCRCIFSLGTISYWSRSTLSLWMKELEKIDHHNEIASSIVTWSLNIYLLWFMLCMIESFRLMLECS